MKTNPPTMATIQPTREQWRKAFEVCAKNFSSFTHVENEAVAIALREYRPRMDDTDVGANPLLHAQV